MITAIACILLGLVYAAWKYAVIRYAARDIYNGGGAPVLDFVVIPPVFLGFGVSTLFLEIGHGQFPGFGALVFLATAVFLYYVMQREYKIGEPIIAKKAEELRNQKQKEKNEPNQ